MVRTRSMVKNLRNAIRTAAGRTAAGAAAVAGVNTARNIANAARTLGNIFTTPRNAQRYPISATSTRTRRRRQNRGTRATINTGSYAGSFNKPKKLKKKNLEAKCLAKGYHITKEIWGDSSDNHCVAIKHATYDIESLVKTINGAIMRKLFSKAGIDINVKNQTMPIGTLTSGVGFRIVITRRVPSDASTGGEETYDTLGTSTFASLLDPLVWANFYGELRAVLTNGTESMPYQIRLYAIDKTTGADQYRLLSNLDLANENLTIIVRSTLKVQNRTKGENAGAADFDEQRIDNQPLSGTLYEFKHVDPRMKFPPNDRIVMENFNSMDDRGIHLTDTTYVGHDIGFTEPPNPKLWHNCVKASKVYLQPGNVKKTYIQHTYSGKFINVLNKLIARTWQAGTIATQNMVTGVSGKSQMLYLEEIIRTSNTNPVTLAYERELKMGAFLTSKKQYVPFVTEYIQTEYNQ